MPPIELRTILKETLGIGAILADTYTIGAAMNMISEIALLVRTGNFIRGGFILAGTSIAILYVLLRSITIAHSSTVTDGNLPNEPNEFIREAAVLAVPIIIWYTIAGLGTILSPFDPVNSAVETIILVSTQAGILTAILYILTRTIGFLLPSTTSRQTTVSNDD